MPDDAADARVLGNANDALLLWGGIDSEAVIRGRLPWLLTGVSAHDIRGHLRLEAGAVLRMMGTPTLTVEAGGRITANGSPDRPITISGLFLGLRGEPSAPSRFTHARLENVRLSASDVHGVIVEDVVGTSSRLIIGAPGSQVRRARFDGSFASAGTLLVDSATVAC